MNPGGEGSRSSIAQNRRAYQRIAAEWSDRQERDYDHEFHERCRALFLEHLRGSRVLEVGCGLGLDSQAFAAAGLRVVASDLVIEFLEIVRRRAPGIPAAAMDMTARCFRAACFDGVYASASLLHVPPALVPETLAGFASLLAPGGVVFIHHVMSRRGLSSYRVDDLLIDNNPAVCYCHEPERLAALLEKAGLNVHAIGWLQPRTFPSPCAVRESLVPYQVVAGK